MSHAHVIAAVIAAFAAGEMTGMALILRLRSGPPPPAPPGARQSQPGDGQVIPLRHARVSAPGRPDVAAR